MADVTSATGYEQKLENPNEFLTADFFHSIISKHHISTPFKITKFENTSAVDPGENFVSKILRNSVQIQLDDGTTQDFSFISKIVGSVMFDEKLLTEMQVFPKEVECYVNLVPEFERIWKEIAGIHIEFGPMMYHHELTPRKILITTNLNAAGYKMLNKFRGLAEHQVRMVLKKISKWHAASRIYIDRQGAIDPMFQKSLFHSGTADFLNPRYTLLCKSLIEILEKTGIDDAHLAALKKWDGQVMNFSIKAHEIDSTDFNVLNHGDLWINNQMFKTEESGISSDVKFIDYQLAFYGSPALEVLYFLLMSTNHELFVSKFEEFFAFYHHNLTESLKQLNYHAVPTLKEFWISLLKKSGSLSSMILAALPLVIVDQKKYGIEALYSGRDDELGNETRHKMLGNPEYLEAAKNLINFFGNRGMLDA